MTDSGNESIDERELDMFFAPTNEQLERVESEKELKAIAKHWKCHVNLSLFNPVFDICEHFREKGKLQKYSPHKIKKLVLKHEYHFREDPRYNYPQEFRAAYRRSEWETRKSRFVLWLEYMRDEKKSLNETRNQDESSNDSLTTVIETEPQDPHAQETQHLEPQDTYIQETGNSELELDSELNAINTESFVFNSEQMQNNADAEDINAIAENVCADLDIMDSGSQGYEIFNTQIPCTSTQSQE